MPSNIQVAKAWAASKAESTFASMQEDFSWEAFAIYLTEQQTKDNVHIVVIGTNQVQAACGVRLDTTAIPPHIPIACEWMWFGEKRAAAKAMAECSQWAKDHGARWLVYATHNKRQHRTRFTEQLHWRQL